MDRKRRILSGKESATLWRNVNKLRDHSPETHMAIYHLACKCQELEHLIRELQKQVDILATGDGERGGK